MGEKIRFPPGATVVSFGGIKLTDKASARIWVPRRNGRPQFLAALKKRDISVAEGGTFALLPQGILGVSGCPICGGPVRRSKHGRPAMACYFSSIATATIRCLKPERLAGKAPR